MTEIFSKMLDTDEFREEFFVAECQARLSEMLEDKGVSRAELARRLDVSRARISQIFSDEAKNLTLRLLVRSYLALGEEPIVISRSKYEALEKARAVPASSETGRKMNDGLAEALIADLLRANLGHGRDETDKPRKRSAGSRDWETSASNVIPMRVKANG